MGDELGDEAAFTVVTGRVIGRDVLTDGVIGIAGVAVSDGLAVTPLPRRHRRLPASAGTGAPIWRTTTGAAVISSPLVSGEHLYVGGGDGWLRAFDRGSGECRWAHNLGCGWPRPRL